MTRLRAAAIELFQVAVMGLALACFVQYLAFVSRNPHELARRIDNTLQWTRYLTGL